MTIFQQAASVDFINYADAASGGTRMPRTNWKDMARYQVALPGEEIAERYTELIRPFADEIVENIHENNVLIATRDALLPKLLSGEIRVKDAEKQAEAVA